MDASAIFIELVDLNQFDDKCLCKLFNINKCLQKHIWKYIKNKLKQKHHQYISFKSQIELNTYCEQYINVINNKYNVINLENCKQYILGSPEYNFCTDCGEFGLCTYKNTDSYSFDWNRRICKDGCLIKCCGVNHIIPSNIAIAFDMTCDGDYMFYSHKMKCNCVVVSRQYQYTCDCGHIIINGTHKCEGCNKISLRWVEKMSESTEIKIELFKLAILVVIILFIIIKFN